MIPNGEKMNWNGHHLVFDIPCRGCFFADKDECPDCDEGLWVEEKPSPWHTGTPTEKGEYLCEYYVNEISREFNIRHYEPDNDWFVKNWEKAKKNFRMIRWQRYYEPYKETD